MYRSQLFGHCRNQLGPNLWVGSHGGMALVIVHPDYMSFDGRPNFAEYPVDLYERLLKYVITRYRDVCWFALPHEVAAYVAQVRALLVPSTYA